jgi:hypothetical protein
MLDKLKHHWNVTNRRQFFTQAGSGLAAIALAAMLDQDGYAAASSIRWLPRNRTSRRAPSPSSGASWKARPAMSISSIPSPRW